MKTSESYTQNGTPSSLPQKLQQLDVGGGGEDCIPGGVLRTVRVVGNSYHQLVGRSARATAQCVVNLTD